MGAIIAHELANTIISEYQTQNAAPGGPALKTADGQLLQGFFVDRKSVEDALASSPNNTGLTVYLAKNPTQLGSPDNVFTLVIYGAEPNPNYKPGTHTTPFTNNDPPLDNHTTPPLPWPPFPIPPIFPDFSLDSVVYAEELERVAV